MALLLKKARVFCWAAGKIRMEEVAACLVSTISTLSKCSFFTKLKFNLKLVFSEGCQDD
jgi:hypothetical protein